MDWATLIQVLTAIGGLAGLAALITSISQRKKMEADSALAIDELNDRVLNRAVSLMDDQEKRIQKLENSVSRLQVFNAELLAEVDDFKDRLEAVREQNRELIFVVESILIGVNTLTSQLIRSGITPEWQMPASLKKWIGDHF